MVRPTRNSNACEGPYGKNLSSAGNPNLEPNITSIGKSVAKLWPFLYIQDGRQPPSLISEIRNLHHGIGLPTLEPNIMPLCCIQPELC